MQQAYEQKQELLVKLLQERAAAEALYWRQRGLEKLAKEAEVAWRKLL